MAKAALAAGLVDKLGDEAAFGDHVAELAGDASGDRAGSFATIDLRTYVKARQPGNDGQIGVLTVAGDIVDGEAGPGTAAGDTIGGDSFSGLTRAFFYAGARALLVSHWYVNSQATVELVTHAFAALNQKF